VNPLWKENWAESRQQYVDWWAGKGLVITMWEHFLSDRTPHEVVPAPTPARDLDQYWLDPEWRSGNLHYKLSRSCLRADMLPVADTSFGPGSLAAALGGRFDPGPDTVWIHPLGEERLPIVADPTHPNWQLHLDLVEACVRRSQGRYWVGMPDLLEGLDVLAALRGTASPLMQTIQDPEGLEADLQAVNDAWFTLFDQIYERINVDGEMTFCYFSLWAPGRMAKIQSDISLMISPTAFKRFAVPFLREQAQKLDYSMYHLDGVGAIIHLDSVLEIEELNAVQWTPGIGQPQGGDPQWYDLYRRVLAAGKSVMPCWVEVDELEPLLDAVGPSGLNIEMNFTCEADVDAALVIADRYR
jgi:hypothetical protein